MIVMKNAMFWLMDVVVSSSDCEYHYDTIYPASYFPWTGLQIIVCTLHFIDNYGKTGLLLICLLMYTSSSTGMSRS
jgi:hypothetical protein